MCRGQGRHFSEETTKKIALLLANTDMTVLEIAQRMQCSAGPILRINRNFKIRIYNNRRRDWQATRSGPADRRESGMKVIVNTISAKLNDSRSMDEFLRQIPHSGQFRSKVGPGRMFQDDNYVSETMIGYYLRSDGKDVVCLIVTNLYQDQHHAIIAFFDARLAGENTLRFKVGLELALGTKLEPDPTDEEIDQAIKQLEKSLT
jgi:hypothetical protein